MRCRRAPTASASPALALCQERSCIASAPTTIPAANTAQVIRHFMSIPPLVRSGHEARGLQLQSVDDIAGADVQDLAIRAAECVVGCADLLLRLAAVDGQIDESE